MIHRHHAPWTTQLPDDYLKYYDILIRYAQHSIAQGVEIFLSSHFTNSFRFVSLVSSFFFSRIYKSLELRLSFISLFLSQPENGNKERQSRAILLQLFRMNELLFRLFWKLKMKKITVPSTQWVLSSKFKWKVKNEKKMKNVISLHEKMLKIKIESIHRNCILSICVLVSFFIPVPLFSRLNIISSRPHCHTLH